MNENQRNIGKRLGYPDELLRPIAADDPSNYFPPIVTSIGTLNQDWYEYEIERKLFLLFKHYKIDHASPTSFGTLARRVAMDWIPGFNLVVNGETRGRKNTNDDDVLVAEEIKRMLEINPTMSLGAACKQLKEKLDKELKRKLDRELPSKSLSSRTLESKYRRGRKLIEDRENFFNRFYKRIPPS